MEGFYRGKNILLTGGAGFVGQLLIDRLLCLDPKVIRILDTRENALFDLRQRYTGEDQKTLRFLLGDVRNLNRLLYAFRGIDIVFHTAAYKHVLECEHNPIDAIETNIVGTSNVIQAAITHNVKKVIYTSSDKAANPSNTMGATKLLGEKLMIAANTYGAHSTVFASCRFGNVVRSSGSVIPLFEEQIARNRRITVTNPAMTRFIISKEQAVELVLLAGALAQGGEVFIMKMPAINIGDLAAVMMAKHPGVSHEIIGKRAGEKMHEELMTEEEMSRAYENQHLYVVFSHMVDIGRDNYRGFTKVARVPNSQDAQRMSTNEIMGLVG
ncbi:MAG: NAD-dependent epimerase/dehydratase family protein [Chloroflexi bacterium]|nr:NAD-dependent epimerase/dehydratase family protein [Chloroflexota bacterium]